jgi:hypothetical protein
MTHACCPACNLRFTRAAAHHLADCPECGGGLTRSPSAAETIGFRLAGPREDLEEGAPIAIAVALPVPAPPDAGR